MHRAIHDAHGKNCAAFGLAARAAFRESFAMPSQAHEPDAISPSVLVCEAAIDLCVALCTGLLNEGFDCTLASTPADAVEQVRLSPRPFACVIAAADERIDETVEMVRQVRGRFPSVPVILLSAQLSEAEMPVSLPREKLRILLKPVAATDVMQAVRQLTEGPGG